MRGELAGFRGPKRTVGRVGDPFVEQGAEREVGKGAEKGSKGDGASGVLAGSARSAKGSQSGEGKGSQLVKGLVGEGW